MLARNKKPSSNEYEGWALLSGVIRKVSQRGKDNEHFHKDRKAHSSKSPRAVWIQCRPWCGRMELTQPKAWWPQGELCFIPSHRRATEIFSGRGMTNSQLSSETISRATVQRRDWGDMGCLGQISGISLQITQVRFSNDLKQGWWGYKEPARVRAMSSIQGLYRERWEADHGR